MRLLEWLLLAAGAAVILTYVAWWYGSREEPLAGRGWAAALRAAALILIWLILINPAVPAPGPGGRGRGAADVALLDASYSMSRPMAPGGTSIWRLAADSVRRYGGAWLFGGDVPRWADVDSLPAEPLYPESRLAPAVRAAAAAGARRAVVLTDGRITDAADALEEARRRGLALSYQELAPAYPELGIADVSAPIWTEAGDTADIRVEIVAAGVEAESVRVELLDGDGRVRAAGRVPVPSAGRFSALTLALPLGPRPGYRRFVARIAADTRDAEPRDDARVFYVRVSERPAGPVLISLVPDWEPSFLIPDLDRLSDVPAVAYLRLADSLVSLDGYRPVARATVERRARNAPLLVLHGYGADAPAWAQALVQRAARLLVLPAGNRGFELPGWGVRVGAPLPGEWYVSEDVPPSPLALELAGIPVEALPPLLEARTVYAEGTWAPLELQRLRRGEPLPAVVLGPRGARRWAVAAGQGFWRWAFRPGPSRQLYRALWTGVAGWLMEERARGDVGLEPRQRVVARGGALRWVAPARLDSLSVELQAGESGATWHAVAAGGDSLAVVPEPGRYRYTARAYQDGALVASARGPAEVEQFSPELLPTVRRALRDTLALAASARGAAGTGGSRAARRLATLGWPYLLLIALFCGEWAVRRFSGLR